MQILMWGTGFAAQELMETELKGIDITAFIDNKKRDDDRFATITPEEAVTQKYDAVIVATGYAREIYEQAVRLGFDMSKFIFVYNNYLFRDLNTDYELAARIFTPRYVDIIKNRYHVVRGMMQDEIKTSAFSQEGMQQDWHRGMYESDYNRLRTFELVAEVILENQVRGAVAELGVFKGEFARYINLAFPDRKCYLFDTFEGFRTQEAADEKDAGNCGEAFIQRFKDTSIQNVLKIMPNPDTVICKQGLFPESLNGLEDEFAFVSVDVDFEQSIYDGISYFYPRLNDGGYMFIHDYNSSTLKGVKKAIRRYEKENEVRLSKVPIPDLCGTLVITK